MLLTVVIAFNTNHPLFPHSDYIYSCSGYVPIRTPARKLTATPTPLAGTPIGFFMQTEEAGGSAAAAARLLDPQPRGASQLPFMKPEDAQYFDKLLVDVDEDALSPEDLKERKIMKLLLKIKVGW